MSWDGNYWGPEGALTLAKEAFSESEKTSHDFITLASVLHSAGNRAWAEARDALRAREIGCAYFWSKEGFKLKRSAMKAVDDAWHKCRDDQSFSLDEVDVSMAVWGGIPFPGFYQKGKILRALLMYADNISYSECKPHTRAFFISHALEAGFWKREPTPLALMENEARKSEDAGELAQASRVWKHAWRHWVKLEGKDSFRAQNAYQQALRLAKLSSPDQVVKIG